MTRINIIFAAALLIAVPTLSEAGPPLLCHPFQTANSPLLPWGSGPGWNTPSASYDVRRLPDDLLRLLSTDAPVLARMENMRRAVIYAWENPRLADQLIAALAARTTSTTGREQALALFDAGYILETYKQGAHRHHRTDVQDGYSMVLRAITMTGGNAEMEFAASLMTEGERAQSHIRRARAAASAESLLAKNIETLRR
jgi:hypothetical protein